MAATLEQIRLGIAAALQAIPGLQANGYMMSQPTPPAVEVFPAEVQYHQAMGQGLHGWTITVRGFVGLSSDIGAQKLLDRWLAPTGDHSFREAIEADQSLGGIVDAVTVQMASGYTVFIREGSPPFLGAEWTVEVMA